MSLTQTETKKKTCPTCNGNVSTDGVCLNVNCESAQVNATQGATRKTAKVAVRGTAPQGAPRSFNVRGGVD